MSVAAILVATALDEDTRPIALMPWDENASLVEHSVASLREAGIRDVEVVVGRGADEVIPLLALDNVEAVVAAGDAAAVLRAGASAVPRGTAAAIVTYVEEPRPAAVYEALLEAVRSGASIARASYGGRAGEPVALDETSLAALRNITDARGMPAFLARRAAQIVDVPHSSDVVLRRIHSARDLEMLREIDG